MKGKRPPEPEIVKVWRDRKMPKCCHTCDSYGNDGWCYTHDDRPPDDFAATVDACPSWISEIPF